jgi:thiamine pyrophosphate-dependent acetolactate synthase large subunit-like protein
VLVLALVPVLVPVGQVPTDAVQPGAFQKSAPFDDATKHNVVRQ